MNFRPLLQQVQETVYRPVAPARQESLLNADLRPHPRSQNDQYECQGLRSTLRPKPTSMRGSQDDVSPRWTHVPSPCEPNNGEVMLKRHLSKVGQDSTLSKMLKCISFLIYDRRKSHTLQAHLHGLPTSQAMLIIILGVPPTSICYSIKPLLTRQRPQTSQPRIGVVD